MILEAKAENCFSRTHVLKIDGQPVGKFEGRFFSEGLDVSLRGHRRFRFEKEGIFSSEFHLMDGETDAIIGTAKPAGIFTSTWELRLSIGHCTLEKTGFFSSSYELKEDGDVLAHIDRLGMCERGWMVKGDDEELIAPDLLLIGLIYQIILTRQQRAAGAAAAGS